MYQGLPSKNAVLDRGVMVRTALRAHQGICQVLDGIKGTAAHEIRPLFMLLDGEFSQRINWEMLCDTSSAFVALDRRSPIGRIVKQTNPNPLPPSELEVPVRLMVVISALGIGDQKNEWKALRDAVIQARKNGLAISVKVLVGLESLYDSIEVEIAGGLDDVELGSIASSSSDLTQAISNWAPHILHFFCHGFSDSNGQQLELATTADHALHDTNPHALSHGSVTVTGLNLRDLGYTLKNTWLVVLNCCSIGNATSTLPSMAAQVCTAGIPAVVAMMEPVTSADAYRFTKAFYPGALALILDAWTDLKAHASTTLELTTVMYSVRNAIAQGLKSNPQSSPHWSLPVLYVRSIDPQLFVRPAGGDNHVRLKTTAQLLTATAAKMNAEQANEILKKMLGDIPEDQWPTAEGDFHHGD